MRDPNLAIAVQDAVRAALLADANIVSLVKGEKGIHDKIPDRRAPIDETKFPYIVIGEDEITDDSNTCMDSSRVSVAIHVWSAKPGKTQAKQIGGYVVNALDRELSIDGHSTAAGGFDIANAPRIDDNNLTEYVLFFSYDVDPL